MKKLKDMIWPLIGIGAVIWSVRLLYLKLKMEALVDVTLPDGQISKRQALLEDGTLWQHIQVIAGVIGEKLASIPAHSYILAIASTVVAYIALAWYDRIALIHLKRDRGISFIFVALCSFTTYAISHNIGGSVFSGGMVRYRAYSSKGLHAPEIAVLIAITTFTFSFGTILCGGLVLLGEPQVLNPLMQNLPTLWVQLLGCAMLVACGLYILGSYLQLPPLSIRGFKLEYPNLGVVGRQLIAAPVELMGAAGIIYFALPHLGNPGFFVVLGAFLLSFSAGLLFQVPGGIGVMEAVFLKVLPGVPPISVFAALLVWRLLYLICPLVLSIPVILLFERQQFLKRQELGTS
jgi:uncharacterized membrane protein YbhN (UPF0104 family)